MKKYIFTSIIICLAALFFLSGCIEPRYYHEHHEHSKHYNDRHQRRHSPRVDIDLHN